MIDDSEEDPPKWDYRLELGTAPDGSACAIAYIGTEENHIWFRDDSQGEEGVSTFRLACEVAYQALKTIDALREELAKERKLKEAYYDEAAKAWIELNRLRSEKEPQ